jgi:phosphoglycerol transferase MdoB-like AlkP superfamily enzyme
MTSLFSRLWDFHRAGPDSFAARLGGCAALCALAGMVLSGLSLLVTTQSLRQTLAALFTLPFWGAALFLALVTAVLSGLTRSLLLGGGAVVGLSLLASFANYFKMRITSTPLEVSDLALIGTMGNIARLNAQSLTLGRNSLLAIAGGIAWIAVLWFFSRPLRLRLRRSLLAGAGAALAFCLCFVAGADALFYTPLRSPLSVYYSQAYVNANTRFVLGLWRGAVYRDRIAQRYGAEAAEEVRGEIQNRIAEVPAGGGDSQANVILILSESFFDVTGLPGVTYAADPVADFRALCAEGVSGPFHTRSLGYNTCNIELEGLTGVNTHVFGTRGALTTWAGADFTQLPTVPQLLSDAGYYTAFLHMFNDSIYHRKNIMPGLGFQEMFFPEDFGKIDPEAPQKVGDAYWNYMLPHIAGWFYSDDYMTDLLIDLFEQKKDDGPVFLYAASMENHSVYTADKYAHYDYPFTAPLSEEAAGALNAATQGAADASKALKKLTDYLKTVDKPTVVVFFGDHRPGLGLAQGGSVYSALGMCPADSGQWSPEQYAELYCTDYLIWANDPALLPAAPGSTMDISCNDLGAAVLNAAGVEKPDYWRLIESLRRENIIYTTNYYLPVSGAPEYVLPETAPARAGYDLLAFALYDAFADRYLTDLS